MNFTEEQLAFRDSIRRMAERHVAPIAAEIDETDRFPTELLPIYGDMGLMQLWVPEKYGGPEGNLTLMCIAREEISRHSPACGSIAGLNTMFIMPLLHFGTEEQRQRFLPQVAEGGVVTAIAISEPQAGSDVSAMHDPGRARRRQLRHQRPQAVVQLRRRRRVHRPDGAHHRRARRRRHQRLRPRAEEDEGHHLRPPRDARWAGAARPNTPIFLDNVRVPIENLVGEEGKGFRASMRALDLNRPDHRRAVRRPGPRRARRLDRLRQGAQAVQAARSPSSRACSSCSPTWR